MIWTPEITALTHQLWNEGLSSSAIGLRIGCSRNAVIGRVNRDREKFGLSWHSTEDGQQPPQKPKEARKPRKASSAPVAIHHPATDPTAPRPPRKPRKPRPRHPAPIPEPPKPIGTFHILDLKDSQCRFPTSSLGDQHLFCGSVCEPSKSYCPEHILRVYQSTSHRAGSPG